MSKRACPRSVGRMLLAVLIGYAVVAVVVLAGTAAAAAAFGLRMDGPPTTPYLALNIAVSFLAAIGAGYVSARLAPTGRIVMTMGLLILLLLAMAVVSSRLSPATQQPPSYLPLVTLLGVIGVWTGAMIERAVCAGTSRTPEPQNPGTSEPRNPGTPKPT